MKRPPTRKAWRTAAYGTPCSARAAPVARGASMLARGSPASVPRTYRRLSLHEADSSSRRRAAPRRRAGSPRRSARPSGRRAARPRATAGGSACAPRGRRPGPGRIRRGTSHGRQPSGRLCARTEPEPRSRCAGPKRSAEVPGPTLEASTNRRTTRQTTQGTAVNLARLFTDTAADRPEQCRSPPRRADHQLRRARRGQRAGSPACWPPTASQPGDRVARDAAQRPRVRRGLLRRAAGRRGRRTDEPAAQGPRGGVLPVRLRRQGALRLAVRGRRGRRGAERVPGAERGRGRARTFATCSPASEPVATVVDRDADGHRSDPLHLGHHGPAQGRRAHARQPASATSRSPSPTCCT